VSDRLITIPIITLQFLRVVLRVVLSKMEMADSLRIYRLSPLHLVYYWLSFLYITLYIPPIGSQVFFFKKYTNPFRQGYPSPSESIIKALSVFKIMQIDWLSQSQKQRVYIELDARGRGYAPSQSTKHQVMV